MTQSAAGTFDTSNFFSVDARSSDGSTFYDVTLTNAGSETTRIKDIYAKNFTYLETDAIIISTNDVTETFTLTAGGAITDWDEGMLAASGSMDAVITARSSDGSTYYDITLDDVDGNFQSASVIGKIVELVDANAIDLGASDVSGTYAVTATAGGDITDSGVLDITGNATFTAAAGQQVLLDSNNTFAGTVTFSTPSGNLKNVTITDTTALDLTALTLAQVSSAGGDLTVTAGGALTDTGPLIIPGTTTITATGQTVELDNTSNNFGTILFGSSSNAVASVEVEDTDAIAIGASNSSGNFTITAGGAVTDSGTVTVGGNLAVTTDAGGSLINMGTLEVDGTIALNTNGSGAATVVNDTGIEFAASTVGGALSATATTGDITDSGALTITGATTLVTSESDATIKLDTSTNKFAGNVDLSTQGTRGHVTLVHGDHTEYLDFAASEVRGNLTVTTGTGGRVRQFGILTVDGTTDINADDKSQNVILNDYENVLTGTVSLKCWNCKVKNSKALELGTVDAKAIEAIARGAITQSAASVITATSSNSNGTPCF